VGAACNPGKWLTAGPGGTATGTGAAARIEIHGAGQPEPDIDEVDLDGLDLLYEILVDDVLEAIDVKNLIGVFWLIQSQCQRGAASAAGVKEHPNGRDILAFKILSNLFGGCRSDFNHELSPPWLIRVCNPAPVLPPGSLNFQKT
jgi:hypothetical protein